jgi:hypothetical protein
LPMLFGESLQNWITRTHFPSLPSLPNTNAILKFPPKPPLHPSPHDHAQ